ncbi:MAG: hypothetical protein RLY30_1718 [Pseudomonadota bacterium]|jgi:hypothetical protein
MASIIEAGRITPVEVVYLGSRFNIWRLERQIRTYAVFDLSRGSLNIDFTGEDADELEQDLEVLRAQGMSSEALEAKLASKIDPFLASIQQ